MTARIASLFAQWCESLARLQIDAPSNPAEHGAFRCPACNFLHGRASDAVYPLLAMAQRTGDARYHRAALRAAAWSRNVDAADGSWTNELDPHSWKGTTVFAAIAWANAIVRHGGLLDTSIRDAWCARLRKAGAFIRKTFDYGYGNINYPITATHALFLLGKLLHEPEWQTRARALASRAPQFFTEPHQLLYGEGAPAGRISPLGCRAVDLGYNVEESLPSLFAYARLAEDGVVERAVRASMRAHLEFLLPDGGWDNSWGTRSFKWTYWGSRTSDGAIGAYLGASAEEPGFRAAMERHLGLLEECTHEGLLYGGPHLAARGAPPCMHHTLSHVKALADALHEGVPERSRPPSPARDGVRAWPEIGTWIAAHGPWRATVTRNDWLYHAGVWHPTGGAISLLHHAVAGPILAGSLAEYRRVEEGNMQVSPDKEDYPLTPRVELMRAGVRCSTLYDLHAECETSSMAEGSEFRITAALRTAAGESAGTVKLRYRIGAAGISIAAQGPDGASLILPVIARNDEPAARSGDRALLIRKRAATVKLTATVPLELRDEGRTRIFNLVPGFLAVPVAVPLRADADVECRITV